MRRKVWATLGLVLVLVISLFGTAAGQSGTDPVIPPEPEPVETDTPGSMYWSHPVVKLLDAYFGPKLVDDPVDPEDPTVPEEPSEGEPTEEVPTEEPGEGEESSGLTPVGEEIAAYHADGMGFGVLVKLYAMALEAKEACAETPTDIEPPADPAVVEEGGETDACTPVTVEELVKAFQSGTGMGALFKEYGKPNLLGVGHVRKANNPKPVETPVVTEPAPDDTPVDTQTVEKGGKEPKQPKGKPEKTRPDKAKGPNK